MRFTDIDTFKEGLQNIFEAHNKVLTEKAINVFETMLVENDDFDPFSYIDKAEIEIDEEDCVLTLGKSNEKLANMNIVYLSLPAGYTCPFAAGCKTYAHKKGGKFKSSGKSILDAGGDMRCYAASTEARYPNVRESRWSNYELLKATDDMAGLISRSIIYYNMHNPDIKIFRIHESGDFFSQEYFDAWIEVANRHPNILFYAYTVSLPYWQDRKDEIPKNLRLIASQGGLRDDIIDKEGFRKAVIVQDKGEAIKKNLNIDVADFLAVFGDEDFALLLHGIQSKESGMSGIAMKNSSLLKKYAKTLRIAPDRLIKLLGKYVT